MKFLLALTLAAALLATPAYAGTDAKGAVEAFGFTQVVITGTSFFGCGQDDSMLYNKSFTAKSVNGKPVTGHVCGAFTKGYTVRID